MDSPEQGPKPSRPRRELPPELQFLHELPRTGELPADEMLAWMQNLTEQVRRHADLMRQHGIDPDHILKTLQPGLDQLDTAQRKLDAALDIQLHAAADQAEATRNLVDKLEDLVVALRAENPFHPDLDQLEDQIQQLREHYPKL